MRVLIACEFSGTVRDAFRQWGDDAWSCDLLDDEKGSPYHIKGDARQLLSDGWDLLIAHPPCTYLTNAGVRHLHEDVVSVNGKRADVHGSARMTAMREAADFFNAFKFAPIAKIAIENPVPHRYAVALIGFYTQLIQPWQFECGETKATCLWLKNLPKLKPTAIVKGRFARVHLEPPSPDRWKNRSRTYPEIARAMALQWGRMATVLSP